MYGVLVDIYGGMCVYKTEPFADSERFGYHYYISDSG